MAFLWYHSFPDPLYLVILQFNLMKDRGTRIIIYNLWEDDQGLLELDFTSDRHVCFFFYQALYVPAIFSNRLSFSSYKLILMM